MLRLKSKTSQHPFWSYFLFLLTFYTLIRVQFIIWNWANIKQSSFEDIIISFLFGARFDLSVTSIQSLPLFLLLFIPRFKYLKYLRAILGCVWILTLFPVLSLNIADIEYINFTGRRFAFSDFTLAQEANGKIFEYLKTYWLFVILNVPLMVVGAIHLIQIWWLTSLHKIQRSFKHKFFSYFLTTCCLVLFIRGGWQQKPLALAHAMEFQNSSLNSAILNSTFTIIQTRKDDFTRKETYFENRADFLSLMNGANGSFSDSFLKDHRAPGKQNVVIFILESFAEEYRDYTPFLNRLSKDSLNFTKAFANGKRSVDAIPAITSSIPSMLDVAFILSTYLNMDVPTLPQILNKYDYNTYFFHGGNNGTMHFDDYARRAGYKEYIGASEYPYSGHHDGTWGIFDEPFFQYVSEKVSSSKVPFLATVFSLSSHHPYKIPDHLKDRFKDGPLPILKTIGYSDYALEQFFETAKKQPWYNNTLFIITADHTALHYKENYDHFAGIYHVPLLFFHPGYIWPKQIETTHAVQHIDVPESVYDFLGLTPPLTNLLAKSVFVPGPRSVTVYVSGRYAIFSDDFVGVLEPGSNQLNYYSWVAGNAVVPLKQDPAELEQRLKASIQYFNEGINQQKLFVPRN